jgi:AcrR family transcriptional regulator
MGRLPGHGPGYEIRRQKVIRAGARVFARKGYLAATVDDVGRAAKLSRGALYYYIGSKENLLVEIQSSVMIPLLQAVREVSNADAGPMVRLRLVSEVLLSFIFRCLDYIWVYEREYRNLGPARRRQVLEQRHEFERIVQSLIEEAIARGMAHDLNPRLAMLQYLNMHNHTYTWLPSNREWSATTLSTEYCRTLFAGFFGKNYDVETIEGLAAAYWRKYPLDLDSFLSHSK